ncbi:polysaccharide deacetylase family protein [Parachitinimonas caeni]|uniref:Polysaccharide deacetylase family protein n=1 Tax=Parachitinimonas caeni TaxID=3031301 RepID=A0ABT7E1F3_9NEIS|nr:polysaccharide deacetylase family protein [Parachitinimonas caeni]MDK2125874.1 polysaccharide deacetylase family protein [Parachitinimonas caeni]
MSSSLARQVAITFDDGPVLDHSGLLDPVSRNQAILCALAAAEAPACYFVNLSSTSPAGVQALAQAWLRAGHSLGNHTASHCNLDNPDTPLDAFVHSIADCDLALRHLGQPPHYFRYPYLRHGEDPVRRQRVEAALAGMAYQIAPVTLDTSDWRLDQHLQNRLRSTPAPPLEAYRQHYLAHIQQRSHAYAGLSGQLLGRALPQILLLHHNLLNALFLADVLALLRAQGWQFISLEQALADPFYTAKAPPLLAGQSLLLAYCRAAHQPIDARLTDNGDWDIAALNAATTTALPALDQALLTSRQQNLGSVDVLFPVAPGRVLGQGEAG